MKRHKALIQLSRDHHFGLLLCWKLKEGIKAIIQPGGSMRDEESIEAANEHGIPMMFTGMRHFLH